MQLCQLFLILYELERRWDEFLRSLCVSHEHRSILIDERQGVMCLMIFGDVRRRHEDGGFAKQA